MSTPNNTNLFFDESENKFYSENPSEIIKAINDDCNSSCLIDRMMAESVKKMIQDTDGKVYQLHTDKLSIHIVRTEFHKTSQGHIRVIAYCGSS